MILGIESSCDDTGIAVIDLKGNIVRDRIISQVDVHKEFGGVVPEFASRAHILNMQKIIPDFQDLLINKLTGETLIKLICVTSGPGLLGSLLTGVMFGAGLANSLSVPLLKINHLEGHLLSPFIENKDLKFPFLSFIISGGNCLIVFVRSLGDYTILGQTMDDSPGEVFDKIGRALGFDYPAGATVDKFAQMGQPRFNLPLPTRSHSYGANMSFSGLKTATLDLIKANLCDKMNDEVKKEVIADICSSFQKVISQTVYNKLKLALLQVVNSFSVQIKHIVLCGGVAANSGVRGAIDNLAEEFNITAVKPSTQYCTDNAAMIAMCGLLRCKSFCDKNNINYNETNKLNNLDIFFKLEEFGKVASNWGLESVKNTYSNEIIKNNEKT
ncbi:MAG: tRNA (adenosine(37)-N6)-threonylcarbamoyltransferase complex transferase subunit TsaD [Alphaproteobacteria bacterium]|nr:tRNA (adenosine(37)-N6)-threonylcarbamoyltransferase complex transferase subunit TsaD [Rickettsiales bacterium]